MHCTKYRFQPLCHHPWIPWCAFSFNSLLKEVSPRNEYIGGSGPKLPSYLILLPSLEPILSVNSKLNWSTFTWVSTENLLITSSSKSEYNANDSEAFYWYISMAYANYFTFIFLVPQPVILNTHGTLKLSCNWAGDGYTAISLMPKTSASPYPGGGNPSRHLLFTLIIESNLHLTPPFSYSCTHPDDDILWTRIHASSFTSPI